MRWSTTTAALLFSTSTSSLVSASNANAECFQNRSDELARLASCGDWGSINWCLSHTPSTLNDAAAVNDLASLTVELETCFINAGYNREEAQAEAFWTLRRCEVAPEDLKRRFSGLAAEPLAVEVVQIREPHVTAAAVARQATTSTASPTPCLTTTSVSINSCPHQSTGPDSGKPLPCFPTTVPSLACAAGLICQTNPQGAINCMYAQNSLNISGIIVAIVMATAIVLSVFGICFFCCRERRTQNRLAKAAEAAAIAREAKAAAMVANKRPELGARVPSDTRLAQQPLMGEAEPAGPNPFADTHPALR